VRVVGGHDLIQVEETLFNSMDRWNHSYLALPTHRRRTSPSSHQGTSSGLHATGGRPTVEFAGFCGALRVDWHFCQPRDAQAKGGVERLQDFMERSFEPGRCFANELDFGLQLDARFDTRANPRMVMAPLPAVAPDIDRHPGLVGTGLDSAEPLRAGARR
jgi:hypothetical protein